MLSTTLTYQELPDYQCFDMHFVQKRNHSFFQIYLDKADKTIADIKLEDNIVTFEYSSELLLEEYIIIHNTISRFQEHGKVELNDQNSFLGYLADGEPAYIMTNWKPWLNYLNNSMKNCL